MTDKKPQHDPVQGEGDYNAARRFRRDAEAFIQKKGDEIPGMAKDAERAIEGPEGDQLRKAEEKGKSKARQ